METDKLLPAISHLNDMPSRIQILFRKNYHTHECEKLTAFVCGQNNEKGSAPRSQGESSEKQRRGGGGVTCRKPVRARMHGRV